MATLPGSNLIVKVGPPLLAGAESRLIWAEVACVALPQVLSSDKSDASASNTPLKFVQFVPNALLAKIVFTTVAVPKFDMLLPPLVALFFEKVQLVTVIVVLFWIAPATLTEVLL